MESQNENNEPILKDLIKKLHFAIDNKNTKEEIKALIDLASYHYENEEFEKSKRFLEQVLEINKEIPEIYYFLALNNLQQKEDKKALKNIEKELKLNPNNIHAKELYEKLKIHSNFPTITIFMIFMNILTYMFISSGSYIDLLRFGATYDNISIFTIITSIFFHNNIYHLLFNMIALAMFGLYLEKYIGTAKLTIIYMISGITGNLMQALLYQNSFVIGASASIFGIIGSMVMREPLFNLRLLGIIKVPIIIVIGLFFSLQNILGTLVDSTVMVADIAHLFGFLSGVLVTGAIYRETINVFYNWLAIAAGFWMIIQSAVIIEPKLLFSSINTIISIILLITGIFLIFYSYMKLSEEKSIKENMEGREE